MLQTENYWKFAVQIACLIAISIASGIGLKSSNAKDGLGDHYLLLVSYMRTETMNSARLEQFDKSAYDGVAVAFTKPYDVAAPPTVEEMSAKITEAKKYTSKDLWPWVYFTRMVGRDPEFNAPNGRDPYFFKIRGADLENAAGAQDDFATIWRNSLRVAKENHIPGIVVDLEFYMNYKAYNPAVLGQQMGKEPQATIDLLKKVGARLADTAAKEYPDAALWFLFTDLGEQGSFHSGNGSYYPSPAYVVMGLLDQIQARGYSLEVISGGEVGLGYCSLSVSDLQRKVLQRTKDFAGNQQKYGRSLELAGTMMVWNDRKSRSGFSAEGICAKSDAGSIEELEPYLEALLKAYRYNWIYGVYDAGYDPFHPRSAPRFDVVISRAKQNTGGTISH